MNNYFDGSNVTPVGASKVLEAMALAPHGIRRVEGTEWACFAGDCTYEFFGWQVTVFNDCDSFDYVDRIVSPSGESSDFDYFAGHSSPMPECLVHSQIIEVIEARFRELDDEPATVAKVE